MVSKEQAMTKYNFILLEQGTHKTSNWRANGKCKTWVTRPDEFKLPIKHGLYNYGYLTNENAHLFIVN